MCKILQKPKYFRREDQLELQVCGIRDTLLLKVSSNKIKRFKQDVIYFTMHSSFSGQLWQFASQLKVVTEPTSEWTAIQELQQGTKRTDHFIISQTVDIED